MFYFQTSNPYKFNEAKEILADHGIEIEHIREEYQEIQGDTLEEVAESSLDAISGENIFIEDAGLFIEVLNGFPGVYSSYVLATIDNPGILKLMQGLDNRDAKFVSVVALKHKGEVKLFKGEVRGTISHEPGGDLGFGYDPIFLPQDSEKTFAEDISLKKEISHRREALEKLARYIKNGEIE